VSPAQRKEMIAKLETDPHFGSTVGEPVILPLDRLDLVSKAELAGSGFCAYCLGVIDATTLDRINFALDRIQMRDLTRLPEFVKNPRVMDNATTQSVVNAGLAYYRMGSASTDVAANHSLCDALIKYVLMVDNPGQQR
jgi:hypothetical protein